MDNYTIFPFKAVVTAWIIALCQALSLLLAPVIIRYSLILTIALPVVLLLVYEWYTKSVFDCDCCGKGVSLMDATCAIWSEYHCKRCGAQIRIHHTQGGKAMTITKRFWKQD